MSDVNVVRVAVVGAAGRMGRLLCALTESTDGLALAEAVESAGHEAIGTPGGGGATIASELTGAADVVIDFSVPDSTRRTVARCVELGKPIVIGTTGLSADDQAAIDAAAKRIAVCQASNFSLVVNVLNRLAAEAARLLGNAYDIEIVEAHHRFKRDAPSGTALSLARTVCEATGRSFDRDVVLERHGDDVVRKPNEITVQAIRLGDTVGEHTVYFGTLGERMELRHVGGSRDSYAGGAVRAARWLVAESKAPGRYDMADVLGLREA